MADFFNFFFKSSDGKEKIDSAWRQDIAKRAKEIFDLCEYNGKLWISNDGVPIETDFENIESALKKLELLRQNWTDYALTHSRPVTQFGKFTATDFSD